MIGESIKFEVLKWDYNPKAPTVNPHRDFMFYSKPLIHRQTLKTEGLAFKWTLTVQMDDIEKLHYASEEMFIIPNKSISDADLLQIIHTSYDNSYRQMAFKNLAVGFDCGFDLFETIPFDLSAIKKDLQG